MCKVKYVNTENLVQKLVGTTYARYNTLYWSLSQELVGSTYASSGATRGGGANRVHFKAV